uniref:Reverse transcriptase Ty1/copia-type domain-containing protein n=1 Tax=Strongyloides stercoralis TaxID=6248 RepID=A0A0K0DTV6_STRER
MDTADVLKLFKTCKVPVLDSSNYRTWKDRIDLALFMQNTSLDELKEEKVEIKTAALRTTLSDKLSTESAEIETAADLIREIKGKFKRSKTAVMLKTVNQLLMRDQYDYLKLTFDDITTVETIILRLRTHKDLSIECRERSEVFVSKEDWRKNATYYVCNKKGHIPRQCPRKNKKNERAHIISEESEWNLEVNHSNRNLTEIIIDSGATLNIIRSKEMSTKVKSVDPKSITYGNEQTVKVDKVGSINICGIEIENCYYEPNAAGNLLSMSKLVDKGLIKFDSNVGPIALNDGKISVKIERRGNLYIIIHKSLEIINVYGFTKITAVKPLKTKEDGKVLKMGMHSNVSSFSNLAKRAMACVGSHVDKFFSEETITLITEISEKPWDQSVYNRVTPLMIIQVRCILTAFSCLPEGWIQGNKAETEVDPSEIRRRSAIAIRKARLVVKEYEEEKEIYHFASTTQLTNVRLIILLASKGMSNATLDIDSTFLQSDQRIEKYAKLPKEYVSKENKEEVMLLKKPLYGLREAPVLWNATITKFMLNLGYQKSMEDLTIFKKSETYVVVYVDDILIASKSKEEIKSFSANLKERFDIKNYGIIKIEEKRNFFKYEITRGKENEYKISMRKQIDKDAYTVENKKLNEDQQKIYKRLLGKLLYIAINGRSDIAYSTSGISSGAMKWKLLHRIIGYLKETINQCLTYSLSNDLKIEVYGDTSFALDSNMKSVTGLTCFVGGNIVNWKSTKQKRIAKKKVMRFLIKDYKKKTTLYTHNIPVLEAAAKDLGISTKSRSLKIDFAYVKDNLKFIDLKGIHSENMKADALTKKTSGIKLKDFWMTKQNNIKPEGAEEVSE